MKIQLTLMCDITEDILHLPCNLQGIKTKKLRSKWESEEEDEMGYLIHVWGQVGRSVRTQAA